MPGSTLTTVPLLAENSQATPGLWNNPFGIIERNVSQVNSDFSLSDASLVGWNKGSVTTLITSTSRLSINTLGAASGNTMRLANGQDWIARSYDSGGAVFNVRAFGAIGDGAANENSAFQAALSAATAVGGVVVVSPGTYILSSVLTIAGPCAVVGTNKAILHWNTNGANRGIRITASDVNIDGLEIRGPQFSSYSDTQRAVFAFGADASNFIDRVTVKNCFIHRWGDEGVRTLFVRQPQILNNRMENIHYAGVQVLSCYSGVVSGNIIDNVIGATATNAYGITVSKNNGNEATFPVSRSILVANNHISNVTGWKGLDTHGGNRIAFVNNIVTDCMTGIALDSFDDGTNRRGPTYCSAVGNIVKREAMGSADVRQGITIAGVTTVSTSSATACMIADNIISGMGDSNAGFGVAEGAAVYVRAYNNAMVRGNVITDSGTHGIMTEFMGDNLLVQGNIIRNLAASSGSGSAFYVSPNGGAATGLIADNVIDVPGYTGIWAEDVTAISLSDNHIVLATTNYNQTGGVLPLQYFGTSYRVASGNAAWDLGSLATSGSTSSIVSNIPGCSGRAVVRIMPDRDLQGLTLHVVPAANSTSTGQMTLFLYNNTANAVDLPVTTFAYIIDAVTT